MRKRKITNRENIPLSVALFLAVDHYDYFPKTISATSLIRPLRQYILARRVPQGADIPDLEDFIAARFGTAIHDGIEKAWADEKTRVQALQDLGYPPNIIERIVFNPKPEDLKPDSIPVYMELRSFKELLGFRVSGKFDFVGDGGLEDFKSTSVYTWIKGRKDEDYILQGSIYRWLNPEIITKDVLTIQFIFTDWQRGMSRADPKYPARRMMPRKYKLMSVEDTEAYVLNRLKLILEYMDKPDEEIPECTDDELWRSEPVWKYYSNPANKARATKNFADESEAIAFWQSKGGKGEIVEVRGQVGACKYCPAFTVCKQKDKLVESGDLILD